ncbi:colanic acid biosynthesis glycosyltransferase WcaL [Pseudoxanthomonas sp. SGD-10]|nr:colanic acid biosynthesis glycosyltransferase WcaL [Pseudoxanthomonas sp. SGD-10]
MDIAIVVKVFPILSESFVLRMIESLCDEEGVKVTIYATDFVDLELLRKLAPRLAEEVSRGNLKLRYPKSGVFRVKKGPLTRLVRAGANFLGSPLFVTQLLIRGIRVRQALPAASFRRLHRGMTHDVIHAQFLPVAVSVAAARLHKATCPAPLISYVRGFDISKPTAVSEREMALLLEPLGLASVTCVSRSLARMIEARGMPAERVEVIYSGIPISRLAFRPPSSRPSGPIRFIQVGRLVRKKGFDLSLKALSMLKDMDFEFLIVGQGELESELRNMAIELGLTSHVHFAGPLSHDETVNAISNSDVMLIPSVTAADGDSEGIPNVAKEAMALGAICIGSSHSGIPELLDHGRTGFIFDEGNLSDFVEKLNETISRRPSWDRIALAARKFVEEEFDATVISRKLISHYRRQQGH